MQKPSKRHRHKIATHYVLSWACALAVFSALAALGMDVAIAQGHSLEAPTPIKIIQFISENILLWRAACAVHALETIMFVFFCVAFVQTLERRYRALTTFALLMVAVAASSSLDAEFTLLVLASDLARDQLNGSSAMPADVFQSAWLIIASAITHYILIANTLNGIAGTILTGCSLAHRNFPKPLAWLGIPVWTVTLAASIAGAMGRLETALLLMGAASLAFITWAAAIAIAMPSIAKQRMASTVGSSSGAEPLTDTTLSHPLQ